MFIAAMAVDINAIQDAIWRAILNAVYAMTKTYL
jgi:hypothetical protein